jgi:hypothetical protein
MMNLECPKCGNTDQERFAPVVESTGYMHRTYDNARAYGLGNGSAVLKGWRCLSCGKIDFFGLAQNL